jgi:hypothetical protein
VQRAGGERGWLGGLGVGETGRLGRRSADGDDGGAQTGMGRQDTVVDTLCQPPWFQGAAEGSSSTETRKGRALP